jgi:hypothetical protein
MAAHVDTVRCANCKQPFEPYTNEWFCSDECYDAYPSKWPKTKW